MVNEMQVTPWDVKGDIDYNKLIEEFGVEKLTDELLQRIRKHTGDLHFMLRRRIFFAHRDLKWLLDEYEKGNKFFLYTGRGPSGPIHLGHLGTWILTKWLQDKFDVELWFQFTDDEKYMFSSKSYEEIEKYLYDNMLDIIALGFNPEKTFFIIDTRHAGLLYKQATRVARRITFSMVRSSFGMDNSSNIGQIFFTAVQAVPAFLPSVLRNRKIPCLIPHAIDQDPHFRLTRDIIPKLGYYKPASIQSSFLPPLTGPQGKMSSSESETAILTTDNEKAVAKKINKYAFSGGQPTIEEHRKKGGNPDIDVSFQYLKFLFEPDDIKLKKIEEDYRSGKLLTGELKKILINKINEFLKDHQKKREQAKLMINKFIFDPHRLDL